MLTSSLLPCKCHWTNNSCKLQAPFFNQLLQKPSVPGGWWTGTAILLVLYCVYEQISFAASRLVSKANGLWQACFRPSMFCQRDWHVMQASSRLQVTKGSSICCPFSWLHNCHGEEPISVLGRSEKVRSRNSNWLAEPASGLFYISNSKNHLPCFDSLCSCHAFCHWLCASIHP